MHSWENELLDGRAGDAGLQITVVRLPITA
jgi:hypothetical protein